jgi:hypothetical protein
MSDINQTASVDSMSPSTIAPDQKIVDQPIFLVGAERSGTTVCRLMIDHHPSITWCNEFEYAVDFMPKEGNWPDLQRYYEHLEIHRIFQATGFEIDETLTYPELVNSFLIQRSVTREKPIVGATVHRHYDRLLKIWPNAKFLHIVRDPRDVAPSCIGMGWAGNVWSGVDRWIEAEKLWEQVSASIPPENKLEFSYGDLIENNQETLNRICEFIGVPYDEKMLTYPENTDYSLPNPNLVSQWTKKLSDREVQLIEGKVGNLLEQRGFKSSGLPPKQPGFFELLSLKVQEKWYITSRRIRVFGLPLLLAETLTRKLNLKDLHKRQRLKMNAIQQTRIKKSLT